MDAAEKEHQRLLGYECPESDPRHHAPAGVLLSDEIEHYANTTKLIDPFLKENLKPAGYELTVGDEFVIGGQKQQLKKDGEIRIPPFNVVVIKTAETINLPRFLIARWNIRVKWAYKGLLWVGGPQVDPGWVGHLFCPLYNLSNTDVVLRFKEPIALMDFETTTPFHPGKSKSYDRPPTRRVLEDYPADQLESALYTQAKQRIDEIQKRTETSIEKLSGRVDFFITSILVIIGVFFAALAIMTTRETSIPTWAMEAVCFSVFASLLSFGAVLLAWRALRRSGH